MTDAQMQELEVRVNAEIRAGRRMYPTLYEGAGDPALKEVLFPNLMYTASTKRKYTLVSKTSTQKPGGLEEK